MSSILVVSFTHCSLRPIFVKHYPKGIPFVVKNTIKVDSNLGSVSNTELESRLQNQIDDSLRVRSKSYPLWITINKPPVYDTIKVLQSETYMKALMNSLGYFSAKISSSPDIDTSGNKLKTTVNFTVKAGRNLLFDSVGYDLETKGWQQTALKYKDGAFLKKGEPYSKQVVGQELDRLIANLRNSGYYKVTREDVYAEADTVASAFLNATLDPFEQARLIDILEKRKEKPTVDVIIRQRPVKDSSHIRPYYIRKVTIFPDVPIASDTSTAPIYDTAKVNGFVIIRRSNKFHRRFLPQYSSLKPGDLYRQDNYFRTINRYNMLGAWQQTNVDVYESLDNDSTLDVEISLYPTKKIATTQSIEFSRNNANSNNPDLVALSNFFGIGLNISIQNRNFARESVQSTSTGRVGVELGKKFVQTVQTSFEQRFVIPKFIVPFKVGKWDSLIAPKTIINFNTSYTDRALFFRLFSFNLAWGYEWGRKNHIWFYRPFNLEYTNLIKRDSLDSIIKQSPFLNFAFNDGLVIGQQLVYRWQLQTGSRVHTIRAGLEESGAIFGFIKQLDINYKLFRFVKMDLQYTYGIKFKNSALAFRLLGGLGIAYGDSSATVKEKTLPFFKQFFAGGPNSMRAWQVRELGWGSNKNTSKNTFDRFGDVQLEGNVEYRFPITTIAGVKLGSALYIDAGNIWIRKNYGISGQENAEFNFSRLLHDLGIGTGTGLRFDFNFFLIRLDYAYKVKDPNRAEQPDKWFYDWKIFNGQLQLGVNYPF